MECELGKESRASRQEIRDVREDPPSIRGGNNYEGKAGCVVGAVGAEDEDTVGVGQ
jgi:hypothetical protein